MPSSQSLDAGVSREIQILVTPLADILYQKNGHELTVTARASSISSSDSVVLTVDVEQFYKFTVTDPVEKVKDVEDATGKALYTFTIKNQGNGQDTFTFSAVSTKSQWSAIFVQQTLALEPGDEGSVQLEITSPEDLEEDETSITDVVFKSQGTQKQHVVALETSAQGNENTIQDLLGEPIFLIVLFTVIILIIISIYLRRRSMSE